MVRYLRMDSEEYEPLLDGDDVHEYPNMSYWVRLDCGTIELFNSDKGLDIICEYQNKLVFSCKTSDNPRTDYIIMKQHISMLTLEYEEE